VSPVRYELGFIPQKTTFFTVTVMHTSNLAFLLDLRSFKRNQAREGTKACHMLHGGFLLVLSFYPEDRGDIFLPYSR
jgi:hypothetical protein